MGDGKEAYADGAGKGVRTLGLMLTKQLLYQLSYTGKNPYKLRVRRADNRHPKNRNLYNIGAWLRRACFIVVRTNGIVQDYIWIWHILLLIRKLCVCPCKCHLNAFFSILSQLVLQWEWVFGLHPDRVEI